jgi:hypothetical protein
MEDLITLNKAFASHVDMPMSASCTSKPDLLADSEMAWHV